MHIASRHSVCTDDRQMVNRQLRTFLGMNLGGSDKTNEKDTCRLVEELLLIGRMAHEVAHCSASLPLALAPLAAWPAATSAPAATTPLAPAAARPLRGAPAAAAAARMRSVRERLDVVAAGSFAAWARWASAALGERLSATLLQESALTVRTTFTHVYAACLLLLFLLVGG